MTTEFGKQTEWVVITGAPSSGKTSVIDELSRRGFPIVREAARSFIEACLDKGRSLDDIRSDDLTLQADIMALALEWDQSIDVTKMTFMDRGIPDSISYLRLAGHSTQKAMSAARIYQYKAVFIFDRLPVVADGVRTEDDAAAAKLDRFLEEDYANLGYRPIRVPVVPVAERADFILKQLNLFT